MRIARRQEIVTVGAVDALDPVLEVGRSSGVRLSSELLLAKPSRTWRSSLGVGRQATSGWASTTPLHSSSGTFPFPDEPALQRRSEQPAESHSLADRRVGQGRWRIGEDDRDGRDVT
jgi:hypothetical protein